MRFEGIVVALLGGLSQTACGTDSGLGGLNGPCERSDRCATGLSCVAGVCTPLAGEGLDGGLEDVSVPDSDVSG